MVCEPEVRGSCRKSTSSTLSYGECGKSQCNLGTDKLFTGQILDDTGLYYYGARYYDPTIGRFISPDPIVQSPSNPQTLNRYSYVLNNPLKYIDPSGFIVEFENEEFILELLESGVWWSPGSLIDEMIQEWADLRLGWEEFKGVESDIAAIMEEAEWVFTMKWGAGEGAIAYTQKTGDMVADIVFDRGLTNPTREGAEGIAWLIAHESVHAVGYTLGGTGSSRFEEALASQFQLSAGEKLGYDPSPGWRLWEYIVPTGMQMALSTANRAEGIDLSQDIGSRALAKDLQTAYAYVGSPYLFLPSYPDSDYWGTLRSLYGIFR